jgi:hypothetical protein
MPDISREIIIHPARIEGLNDSGGTVFCVTCQRHVNPTRKYGVALAKAGATAFFMYFNGHRARPMVKSALKEIPDDLKRRCPICQTVV